MIRKKTGFKELTLVVLCGAGSVLYLRTRRAAEAEHAEAVLAAEFDALGAEDGR